MPKNKPNVFKGQSIDANEFFKTHWQQTPYLFTNTQVDLSCLPDVDQLFDLALHDGVQSRIVFTEDDLHYQAIYDEPDAWDEVLAQKPTLLVSDIEKWFPKAKQLLEWFGFIKSWRFDDLMMSYAPKDASVGAHTDHYDVFLIQVKGTRLWSFDNQPLTEVEMVEDSELSVIRNYQPENTVELKAGDILYLPPEIPHHGISSSDDCVTCSIGLRAPSAAELLSATVELMAQNLPEQQRLKDDVKAVISDASFGSNEINYLRQQFKNLGEQDDQTLAQWFGQVITGYRLFDESPEFSQIKNSDNYQKNPFAVFAYYDMADSKAILFVNGESHCTSLELAQTICNQNQFKLSELKKSAVEPMNELRLFHQLVNIGAIQSD